MSTDKTYLRFTRRSFVRGVVTTLAVGATAKLAACSTTEAPETDATPEAPSEAEAPQLVKVGFIYVGPKDDFGY
ncbi:MAG: BMP family ABC transporter substrate-binding protein, partial [Cyanobacteria bacterium P01_G01_bin.4]